MGENPFNPKLKWTVGLIASNGKYLTTDTFGPLLHATGTDMKKKQIFTVDPFGDFVYLIAPNGKFLRAGQKGELNAGDSDAGDDHKWTIEALEDGRWAFKSKFNYYLGHKGDQEVHSFGRSCDADTEKFTPHLAIHPQVCIRNNARSSYMHLENGNLNVNEEIPWGVDALINIGYHNGKYSLQSSNGKYLEFNGNLSDTVTDKAQYILVIKDDQVSFKDKNGKYLQTSGAQGKVHSKQSEITKNEMFQLEDSHPQVTLVNAGKYVTWKQGNDVKAIHDQEVTDTEIFQMEVDRADNSFSPRWSFRNCKGGYLVLQGDNVFTKEKQERTAEAWFQIEWLGDSIALKASNGKYVARAPNGALKATAGSVEDTCKFIFNLDNRPQLVLRCDFGFLVTKSVQGKNLVQCTGPVGEVFTMECTNGKYALKLKDNYWKLESDGAISLTGSSPEYFYVELLVHTKLALKSVTTGKYLTVEQTGGFKASKNEVKNPELFEY